MFLLYCSSILGEDKLEVLQIVHTLNVQVNKSKIWCQPNAYNWNLFQASCLNDSLHLRHYAPCGVFSWCQFGGVMVGLENTNRKVDIKVPNIFYLNVTFLYLEMLLHRDYTHDKGRRRGPYEFLCSVPKMSVSGDTFYRDDIEVNFCGKRHMWEEFYRTNQLTIEFSFSTHLKHTYRVMFMYQAVDKKDRAHPVFRNFRGLGFFMKPAIVDPRPYRIHGFRDNDLPFEYRFNIRVPKSAKIKFNHILGIT